MLRLHLREDRDQEEEGGDGGREGQDEVGVGAARGVDGDGDCGHDQEHGRGLAGRGPFFSFLYPPDGGCFYYCVVTARTTFERQ